MPEEERVGAFGGNINESGFAGLLSKYVGKTVTIFTKSGGQSGAGFTGVILAVNCNFVRLLTRIGPAPACSLGNACTSFDPGYGHKGWGGCGIAGGYGMSPVQSANVPGAASAGGWDGIPVYTVGSVTDIPINAIVSFVHDAI